MSYPPLTDYLADWRMDQIKGEDLQDPVARQQISTLSSSVSTLTSSVSTLNSTVSTLSSTVTTLNTTVTGLTKGYEIKVNPYTTSGNVGTVTITNRTVAMISAPSSSLTSFTLNFPTLNSGYARDFIFYLNNTSVSRTINLPANLTYGVPEGENLSDMTTADAGTQIVLYFSEVSGNYFAVHRVTLEDAV